MAGLLEDYALIGDEHTGALVSRDGSIDWLCVPRFDSDACFAALLGTPEHGRWVIAPEGRIHAVRRAYRDGTLVLDTELEVDGGAVRITDCMPTRDVTPNVVRIVEGLRGRTRLRMELVPRFGYGKARPFIRRLEDGLVMVSGPDALWLHCDVPVHVERGGLRAELEVRGGSRHAFVLRWQPSHEQRSRPIDPSYALTTTERTWRAWSSRCDYEGPWREAVLRSLVTLKALTYRPTGGIVASPTTSLPERVGGVRNWDYRYCWVRDATFTLYALMLGGYTEEAGAWRDWLLRAAAGDPDQLQIMYGLAGERRLTEWEVPWLPGYEGSRPVRVGNAASRQHQHDITGELLDTMYRARRAGLAPSRDAWRLQRGIVDHLERVWDEPDEGIWELRSGRHDLVHSKVMVWTALDRAVRNVEEYGMDGPVERWRELRRRVHAEVCERGFHPKRNAFVHAYGSDALDASLLRIPLVGFLPPGDPRVRGTVEAIRRELMPDGFVRRYLPSEVDDGLPPGEGAFLPCSFWLADCLALVGRRDEAVEIFERLLSIRNDVGLLSEEYDPGTRRLVGNFPQAFTHVALVNTARNLSPEVRGPAEDRR